MWSRHRPQFLRSQVAFKHCFKRIPISWRRNNSWCVGVNHPWPMMFCVERLIMSTCQRPMKCSFTETHRDLQVLDRILHENDPSNPAVMDPIVHPPKDKTLRTWKNGTGNRSLIVLMPLLAFFSGATGSGRPSHVANILFISIRLFRTNRTGQGVEIHPHGFVWVKKNMWSDPDLHGYGTTKSMRVAATFFQSQWMSGWEGQLNWLETRFLIGAPFHMCQGRSTPYVSGMVIKALIRRESLEWVYKHLLLRLIIPTIGKQWEFSTYEDYMKLNLGSRHFIAWAIFSSKFTVCACLAPDMQSSVHLVAHYLFMAGAILFPHGTRKHEWIPIMIPTGRTVVIPPPLVT